MNDRVSRRSAVQALLASAIAQRRLFAKDPKPTEKTSDQTAISGKPNKDLAPFDEMMSKFVQKQRVPGAALAVSRHSQLVYARGFGWANVEGKRQAQPESQFRIASVSKPITATAVLQLVQNSKFGLNDRVFDVLPAKDWLPPKHDQRLRQITVRQLLHHTAGWDRDVSFDPIGRPLEIAKALNHRLPVGPAEVVRYTLTLNLDFDPGKRNAYSNVGYLVLGRLIEHVSSQKYEDYVKQHVLAPVGVAEMRLARAWVGDLGKDEAHYYDPKHREANAVNGSRLNKKVSIVYGGENVEAYEAHGGWVASAIDLVKFASAFDDRQSSKLLNADAIAAMFARPEGAAGHESNGKPKDSYYGCGWNVRPIGNQGGANTWHNGFIAGTSSLLVRRVDGLNWAVLFNAHANSKGELLADLIDSQIHEAADAVRNWPA
jgi:N-acyl-D-amino-acid deacylase